MKFLKRFLPDGRFGRGVFILAGGVAFGQVLAVILSPVLTRIYSPQDFGNLQVYLSILSFTIVVVTLRYEIAIILPEKDEVAIDLLSGTLLIVFFVALLLGTILISCGYILLLPGTKALHLYIWILPVSTLGAGLYQSLSYWALRQKSYRQLATTKVTQGISQITTQIVLGGIFKTGFVGLLIGDVFGRMTGSIALFKLAWRQGHALFRKTRLRSIWQALVRYRHFPLVSMGSGLLNTAGFALPALMIGKFYGLQVLGWFSLVDRTMGIPSTLVGQSVSQVYMTEAANLAHEDPNALNDLFIKTLKRILQMGAVPFVVFFFLAPDIFSFVFNPSWREAGVYAKLLAAMYYVSIAAAPLLTTMTILEKQSWQLCWDIGRLISTVGALLAGHVLGWSARNSILAYGIALFASYCIHLLLSRALIKQLIKSHEARQVNRNDNKN